MKTQCNSITFSFLQGEYYCPHFTDKEAGAHGVSVTFPKATWPTVKTGFKSQNPTFITQMTPKLKYLLN